MTRHRSVLAATLAVITCLTAAATAQAITIRTSGAVTSTGMLTFRTAAWTNTCNVTLNQALTAGTYTAGQTFGTINRATFSSCTLATPTLTTLPSPMLMANLVGGLMHHLNPEGVLKVVAGMNCLWRGRVGLTYTGRQFNVDSGLMFLLDLSQPLVNPSCPLFGPMTITGTLTPTPALVVTLP